MLAFGVTIPATVPQGSEIPEGLMNNPVVLTRVHLAFGQCILMPEICQSVNETFSIPYLNTYTKTVLSDGELQLIAS
jgi:hypothetical protein